MNMKNPEVGDICFISDRLFEGFYRYRISINRIPPNYNHAMGMTGVIFEVFPEKNEVSVVFYMQSVFFSNRSGKILKVVRNLSAKTIDFANSYEDDILELKRRVLRHFSVGEEVFVRDVYGNATYKKGKVIEIDDEGIYTVQFRNKEKENFYNFELCAYN